MSEAATAAMPASDVPGGATLEGAFRHTRRRLRDAGIETAALDARVLVCAAAGVTLESLVLHPERPLDTNEAGRLNAMIAARLERCPVSRILGEREFWSRRFAVTPSVLDPRPDSETLVETAIAGLAAGLLEPASVLDLGTGSGCLLVTILCECPDATGIAVDRDPEALKVARGNARRHGVEDRCSFLCGDWTAALSGRFDLVISNPPYIETGALDGLAPEVRQFDPRLALDGGRDGLDAYRAIAAVAESHLKPGGRLGLEIGAGQADAVAALLRSGGLDELSFHEDLSGTVRCVFATVLSI